MGRATDGTLLEEIEPKWLRTQGPSGRCKVKDASAEVIDFVPLPIGTGAVGNKAARQRKTTDGSSLPRANGSVSLAW